MRSNSSNRVGRDPEQSTHPRLDHEHDTWISRESRSPVANSADEVFGEVGLILVVVLGAVLAINMVLVAFHLS